MCHFDIQCTTVEDSRNVWTGNQLSHHLGRCCHSNRPSFVCSQPLCNQAFWLRPFCNVDPITALWMLCCFKAWCHMTVSDLFPFIPVALRTKYTTLYPLHCGCSFCLTSHSNVFLFCQKLFRLEWSNDVIANFSCCDYNHRLECAVVQNS